MTRVMSIKLTLNTERLKAAFMQMTDIQVTIENGEDAKYIMNEILAKLDLNEVISVKETTPDLAGYNFTLYGFSAVTPQNQFHAGVKLVQDKINKAKLGP